MRVEFYEDEANEWRWRVKAANNKVIADSGEGYKNYADCIHGFSLLEQLFTKGDD